MRRSRISCAIAFGSIPGASTFATRRSIPRFCTSARTALTMPGYWTLTATRRPSCSRARYTWPIDAAANASVSNSANTSSSGCPRSRLDHLAHLLERHARRGVAQLRELLLEPPVRLRRQRARVDERGHLAELHRGALHLAEHVQHALGRLQLALLGRGPALLLRAGEVGGAGGVGAGRLAAGQPAEARGAAQPAGRDRVVLARHATDGTGDPARVDHRPPHRGGTALDSRTMRGKWGIRAAALLAVGRTVAARAELLAGRRRVRRSAATGTPTCRSRSGSSRSCCCSPARASGGRCC